MTRVCPDRSVSFHLKSVDRQFVRSNSVWTNIAALHTACALSSGYSWAFLILARALCISLVYSKTWFISDNPMRKIALWRRITNRRVIADYRRRAIARITDFSDRLALALFIINSFVVSSFPKNSPRQSIKNRFQKINHFFLGTDFVFHVNRDLFSHIGAQTQVAIMKLNWFDWCVQVGMRL